MEDRSVTEEFNRCNADKQSDPRIILEKPFSWENAGYQPTDPAQQSVVLGSVGSSLL
jgi:hypothetical protein